METSLVVHRLRLHTPIAGSLGSIPGQGTRACVQLRVRRPQVKMLHAPTCHKQTWNIPYMPQLCVCMPQVATNVASPQVLDFPGGPEVRICLQVQGHMFDPWSGRIPHALRQTKPTHHNYWACALEPASCSERSWWCTLQLESSPHLPQLQKAYEKQQRPRAAIINWKDPKSCKTQCSQITTNIFKKTPKLRNVLISSLNSKYISFTNSENIRNTHIYIEIKLPRIYLRSVRFWGSFLLFLWGLNQYGNDEMSH